MTGEQIWEQVNQMWDMETARPVPRADVKPWMVCSVCMSRRYLVQSWNAFWAPRTVGLSPVTHRLPGRVDVVVKCTVCSHVWVHGLAVTREWMEETAVLRKVYWNEKGTEERDAG